MMSPCLLLVYFVLVPEGSVFGGGAGEVLAKGFSPNWTVILKHLDRTIIVEPLYLP